MPFIEDTVDKLFHYGKLFRRKNIFLSPAFFRSYTCPANCGACCIKGSLDFIPHSKRWEIFKHLYPNEVKNFSYRKVHGVFFYTNFQTDNVGKKCVYLNEVGRCLIHESPPFQCSFPLITLLAQGKDSLYIMKKVFGRGWNMLQVDGSTKGSCCSMIPGNDFKLDLNLFEELNEILFYFGMPTKLPDILAFFYAYEIKFLQGMKPQKRIEIPAKFKCCIPQRKEK